MHSQCKYARHDMTALQAPSTTNMSPACNYSSQYMNPRWWCSSLSLGGGLYFIAIAHAGGTPSFSSNKTPDRTTLNPRNGQNSIMDKLPNGHESPELPKWVFTRDPKYCVRTQSRTFCVERGTWARVLRDAPRGAGVFYSYEWPRKTNITKCAPSNCHPPRVWGDRLIASEGRARQVRAGPRYVGPGYCRVVRERRYHLGKAKFTWRCSGASHCCADPARQGLEGLDEC